MAAAQNVRSGSSPVPTHDPDLWSRPPIQTFRKDLIQTFDPDLWNDIMYWWVDVWSSDGCMLLGFLLCSYSPCQAAKQKTVVKPRCQAVKLPSRTCRKVTRLSSQAVQQPSCNCCTSKLPKCQADTVASCKASLPSCQAAHLLPAHLVVLFLSCCIQAATDTKMWVHFWADPDPDPDRSRPDPDHNHNQLRPRPHPALCENLWLFGFFPSSNSWFTIHQLWNSCQRYQECLQSSWIRSVNTIARPLRLSMWPLAKPQTHVEIWCHIMKTCSSSWGLGNLWIMPLYVIPSFQTSGSPRDDPDGF